MKPLLLISILMLAACSSGPKIKENTCYVKWGTSSNKDKFSQGSGLNYKDREKMNLLSPLIENEAILVGSELEKDVFAVYLSFAKSGQEEIIKLTKPVFANPDEELIIQLLVTPYRVKTKDIRRLTKDMEEVSCEEYKNSQK